MFIDSGCFDRLAENAAPLRDAPCIGDPRTVGQRGNALALCASCNAPSFTARFGGASTFAWVGASLPLSPIRRAFATIDPPFAFRGPPQ